MNDMLQEQEPIDPRGADRLNQRFLGLFLGSLILYLFCYGTLPIYDPDFWWHLKSGEVMVKSGGLLHFDPFTFSGDGVVSEREALILQGYWLWEVCAYGLYALLGLNGIFLLNLLIIFALAGVLLRQLFRQGADFALMALLLTPAFYLVRGIYPLERPQIASFLLAALLLVLLAGVRDGKGLNWKLPLLMVLWANVHGGFVVGDIILCLFAAGALLEYRNDLPRLRPLLLWIGAGLGASLLNPTGLLVFKELLSFNNSALMSGISEYQSTWVKFQQGYRFVAILWGLIALYGLGIWSARRLFWPEFFVALFLAYFSAFYLRNIGFFALAMVPVTAFYLQSGGRGRHWRFPAWLSPLLLSLAALFLLGNAYTLWQGRNDRGPVQSTYPEAAITFLNGSGLQGRMFNDYACGGYLLWRLSPQIKIFIDGRGLEPQVFVDWQKITAANSRWIDGHREFELLLDHYGVDFISQPLLDSEGRVPPLLKNLLNSPGWVPVYLDASVYILARANGKEAAAIDRYRIDKNQFKAGLLAVYGYLGQQGYDAQAARAELLLYLSKSEEARVQIEAIRKSNPNHPALPDLLSGLAFLQGQRLQP